MHAKKKQMAKKTTYQQVNNNVEKVNEYRTYKQ